MIIGRSKKHPYALGSFNLDEAEKLRFLRTNFLTAVSKAENEPKIVLCAADCKADELARATLDLACALTAVGKKILVLDIDRKNAKVREIAGMTGKTYNDYLAGRTTAAELGEKTAVDGLSVITSVPDSVVSMRDDSTTFDLLRKLRDRYDYVFVVATPVKDGADAFSCDEASDAVMLFVKKASTRMGFVTKMMNYYGGRERRVLGAVLI